MSSHLSLTVKATTPWSLLLQMSGPPESPYNRNKRHLDAAFPCLLLKDVMYLAKAALLFVKFGTNHVSSIKMFLPNMFAFGLELCLLYGFLQNI